MSDLIIQSTPKQNLEFPQSNSLPTYTAVLNSMKTLISKYISINLYNPALFYAEKFFNLTQNHSSFLPENIYDLANCLYLNKEYSRCVNLIQKQNLMYSSLKFLILFGQSLLACEDYETIISYLDKEPIVYESNTEDEKENKFLNSVKYLILGKAYEMQENKLPALKCYLKSLEFNSNNIEAFNSLVNHHLLDNDTKKNLLNRLSFDDTEMWLYDYYKSKIEDNIYMTNKSEIEYDNLNNINDMNNSDIDTRTNVMDILYKNNDMDLMKMDAEKFFGIRDYTSVYNKLKKINEEDFYYLDIIPMLCSSMIELGKIGELYGLAYKLANNCTDNYIASYAVGCYYYAIGKLDSSRKNFQKCNQLNKNFPECWIALGNCYAAQDESDQALGAYRSCLRLFPGCHYSNLYIGMEFIRTNNYKSALVSFQNALNLNANDPLIYNEIGVVYYKQRMYKEAETYFNKGIGLCNEDRSNVYQSLLLNLGNCYRKMRMFSNAINILMKLYYIDSRNIDVLNAIGYTYSLMGNYNTALEYLHKSNFIFSKDKFASEIINKCLAEADSQL